VQSTMLADYKGGDAKSGAQPEERLLSIGGDFIAYRLSHDAAVEAVRVMDRVTMNRQIIRVSGGVIRLLE